MITTGWRKGKLKKS